MYECNLCNFSTSRNNNYVIHLKTKKHKKIYFEANLKDKFSKIYQEAQNNKKNYYRIKPLTNILNSQEQIINQLNLNINIKELISKNIIDNKVGNNTLNNFRDNTCSLCDSNIYDNNFINEFNEKNINGIKIKQTQNVTFENLKDHLEDCKINEIHETLMNDNIQIISTLTNVIEKMDINFQSLSLHCKNLVNLINKNKIKKKQYKVDITKLTLENIELKENNIKLQYENELKTKENELQIKNLELQAQTNNYSAQYMVNNNNNKNTYNITCYYDKMDEKYAEAPNINLVEAKQLVDKYISVKGLPNNNVPKTIPGKITDVTNKNLDITQFKVCNFKNHNAKNCCLGNLCACYYVKENHLIEMYNEKILKNNNHNIDRYVDVFTDMITLFYDKNNPERSSLWSTDSNRNIFSVKMQVDNESKFIKDIDGVQVDKYPIGSLINHIFDALDNYKNIINQAEKIYIDKFIKLTISEAIKFEKKCKIDGIKMKAGNSKSTDLKTEDSCIIYNNRVIGSSRSKKLNQIISDIKEDYENKITIIEQIKIIIQTDKFSINVKKKLAKHYHVSMAQLKKLFGDEKFRQIGSRSDTSNKDNNNIKNSDIKEINDNEENYIEYSSDADNSEENYDLYDSC